MSNVLAEIVGLEPGEALLFSPSAVIRYKEGKVPVKLGMDWLKVRIRERITVDGGKSVLAI